MEKQKIEIFKDWVNKQKWTFAKTYAKTSPHEYVVRHELPAEDQEIFYDFVTFIRENGWTQMYKGKPYLCFTIDDNYYWTQGAPLPATYILNRARTDQL